LDFGPRDFRGKPSGISVEVGPRVLGRGLRAAGAVTPAGSWPGGPAELAPLARPGGECVKLCQKGGRHFRCVYRGKAGRTFTACGGRGRPLPGPPSNPVPAGAPSAPGGRWGRMAGATDGGPGAGGHRCLTTGGLPGGGGDGRPPAAPTGGPFPTGGGKKGPHPTAKRGGVGTWGRGPPRPTAALLRANWGDERDPSYPGGGGTERLFYRFSANLGGNPPGPFHCRGEHPPRGGAHFLLAVTWAKRRRAGK